MSALLGIEAILARLTAVKQHGENYQAQCPAHDDRTASLSVSVGRNQRILFKCFAGCDTDAIRRALHLEWNEILPPSQEERGAPVKRIVQTYDYHDAAGVLRYQAVRYEPKGFTQRQPDGKGGWIWSMKDVERVPYRLHELQGKSKVYIVEGEKDADALWRAGVDATTNVGGAGKWRASDTRYLKQAGVTHAVLIPDNDGPGRTHMDAVQASLEQVGIKATRIDLIELPIKGDVSDWLASGRTIDQLDALALRKPRPPLRLPDSLSAPVPDDPHGAAAWRRTDLGSAEAFVARFGEKIRFNHKHKEWLTWNCHHWQHDDTEAIRRKASEHVLTWQQEALAIRDHDLKQEVVRYAIKLERSGSLGNLVDLARAMLPVADNGKHWDEEPLLLGCPNGVVDFSTGQLRAGRPEDRITLQTGVPFQPDAECPRWRQFLAEVFSEDDALIAFIQRAVGYSLTGDMHEQCFFMCVGHGANGKSTFLSTLGSVFGDYSYTTDTNVFASNANARESTPFDLAELLGRRLILMSETKTSSRMNEDALKNFTGGEKINAQKKYGHPFEFQPVGKLWMGVNHQPKVVDESHGFWRRVRLIPFERIFSGSTDNRHLKRELLAERVGILSWAVQGCRQWLTEGLNPPLSVMNATDAYQEAENPILEFLTERTEPDPHGQVSCSATYLAYRDWARDQGIGENEMLKRNVFGRLMSKRYDRKHNTTGWRYLGLRVTVRPRDLLSAGEYS